MVRRRKWALGLAVLAAVALSLYLCRSAWLGVLGSLMVAGQSDPMALGQGEAVLVPAADWIEAPGGREVISQAASLVNRGLAGALYMSCPLYYGVSECELAQEMLVAEGFAGITIRAIPLARVPDREEAEQVTIWLARHGVKRVIVVLPAYKSRRLAGFYQGLGRRYGIEMVPLTVPVRAFPPERWWREREGRKVFAYELLRWLRLL